MGYQLASKPSRRIRSYNSVKAAAGEAVQLLESRCLFSAVLTYGFGGLSSSGSSPAITASLVGANATASTAAYGTTIAQATNTAWGGSGWGVHTSESDAISNGDYATFSLTANPGYAESFSAIDPYNIRRSATGPSTGIWQYSVGGGSFTDIGSAITWGSTTTSAGNSEAAINLAGLSALQSVPAGSTVTFRVVMWGGSGSGSGTWYFNDGGTSGGALTFEGSVAVGIAAPTVTGISPAGGSPAGGTSVTITGTNFTSTSAVEFGSNNASSVTYVSATQLTAIAPAGSGVVDVTVNNGAGTSPTSSADQFTYALIPVFSFDPANTYSIAENAGNEVITIDRGSDTSSAGSIDFTLGAAGDTAIAGTNYATTVSVSSGTVSGDNGTLSFAPGDSTQTITIPILIQSPQGGNKQVTLTLANASGGAAIESPDSQAITIVDTPLENINFDSATYSVDENAGTASFTIDRQFSGGATSDTSSVVFTTSDGVPYTYGSTQAPQDAQAGRDYTTTTQTVTFTGTQTQATVTVPLIDVKTFSGQRNFSATLSSPTNATQNGAQTATETISDDSVSSPNGTDTPTVASSYTAGVEISGPYYTNSYLSLVSTPFGSQGFSTFPEMEFPAPSGYVIGSVDSVTLSLDNFGTGGYAGIAGSFDVYSLTDDTVPFTVPAPQAPPAVKYLGGTGNTGPSVIGTQASPVLLGTAYFPNNGNSYNDFTIDNIPSAASAAMAAEQHAGLPIRFAIVPHAGSTVGVEWEGDHSGSPVPQLTLLVEKAAVTQETFSFANASYTAQSTDGVATITLSRSGSNIADTATVNYATSDGNAIAGTNYTATSGTATFAAGSSTTSFNVSVNSVANQNGDKFLNLTLRAPTTDGTQLTAGFLGSQSTATLTIADPTTPTSESLSPSPMNAADVEIKGIYDNSEFKATAKGGNAAPYASFGVFDLSVPAASLPVTAINSATLTVSANGSVEASAAGLLNFYLVSDTTSSITSSSPETTANGFYDASQGVEGLGSQFGTTYLLGSYFFSGTSNTISIPLNYSAAGEAQLISELNTPGSNMRIVMTAEDTSVVADFVPVNTSLSINVHESAVTTPLWLGAGSSATWTPSSHSLVVSGAASIVADPGSDAPIITFTGTGDVLTINPETSGQVNVGGLNLSNGATINIVNGSATNVLMIGSGGLSIDSTSQLVLNNNFIDVEAGAASLNTIDGYIAGHQFNSSNAALGNLSAIAAVQNKDTSGNTLEATFGGIPTTGSTDVLIRNTYFGDANISGVVNSADYTQIDSGYLGHSSGWYNGDFNYDGVINGSDYTLIDNAFNTQGNPLPGPSAQLAGPSATPTSSIASTSTADSFFSDKKVSSSIIGDLENLITTG